MDKYAVTVKRTLVLVSRLEVEAESEDAAVKGAVEKAKNRDRWSESSDSTVAGAVELVPEEEDIAIGA